MDSVKYAMPKSVDYLQLTRLPFVALMQSPNGLDRITQTSTGMCTMDMKKFFFDENKFQNDFTPQEGDIVFWVGHVGLVTEVSKDGKAKVIQASFRQKKVIETVVFCPVDRIKGFATGSFYGFF